MRYDHTQQLQLWLRLCDSLNQEYLSLAFAVYQDPYLPACTSPLKEKLKSKRKRP